MADCEYSDRCPIFAKSALEGTQSFWIRLYCEGPRQGECARKSLEQAGEEVPETLLPNGTHLDPFATFIMPRPKE